MDISVSHHVWVKLFDESEHVVIVLDFLVHLDCHVGIVDDDVESERGKDGLS